MNQRGFRRLGGLAVTAVAFALGGCGGAVTPAGRSEAREPCADRNPLRNVYFGDLHVHTAYSFDAYVFDVRVTPEQAYRFARGEPVELPPLDAQGRGTQRVRIDRPLDFAAVTDHSEFLGEVESCTVPGAPGFDSASCAPFRSGGNTGQNLLGTILTQEEPRRLEDVCGTDSESCRRAAGEVWGRIVAAAEAAYDRSPACSFTTFVAYEYTGNPKVSTNHRNMIFRTASVPFPISYMEEPTALGLWRALRATCIDADPECDVLAIPHNPNQSNGNMFFPEYPGATTPEEQRGQARLRGALEPLVEIYQHKGDSECLNGISGIVGEPDELCDFEKLRQPPLQDCGDGTGRGGVSNSGCVSRLDYARGFLLAGLQEYERLGVNPYRLGFIAGTDTHNGTPGATGEDRFAGHRGGVDDTPEKRLVGGGFRSGIAFSPGGWRLYGRRRIRGTASLRLSSGGRRTEPAGPASPFGFSAVGTSTPRFAETPTLSRGRMRLARPWAGFCRRGPTRLRCRSSPLPPCAIRARRSGRAPCCSASRLSRAGGAAGSPT